jgi:hypothetical protein
VPMRLSPPARSVPLGGGRVSGLPAGLSQSDPAPEAHLGREPDFAHATRPEGAHDLVGVQLRRSISGAAGAGSPKPNRGHSCTSRIIRAATRGLSVQLRPTTPRAACSNGNRKTTNCCSDNFPVQDRSHRGLGGARRHGALDEQQSLVMQFWRELHGDVRGLLICPPEGGETSARAQPLFDIGTWSSDVQRQVPTGVLCARSHASNWSSGGTGRYSDGGGTGDQREVGRHDSQAGESSCGQQNELSSSRPATRSRSDAEEHSVRAPDTTAATFFCLTSHVPGCKTPASYGAKSGQRSVLPMSAPAEVTDDPLAPH